MTIEPRTYRVTIRYGSPRQQYHLMDVNATSLREAMTAAAASYPDFALDSGDLIEIRRQTEPEDRGL